MGCITSKAITRSMSIREELSHGFQSRSAAWEELLTSHTGNDQLFALVCSSNINTDKLKTSSFTLPSNDPDTPPSTKHLGEAWDLIADITAKPEAEAASDDTFRFTRSKSCHTVSANNLDWKDKSAVGSRSFHTVEEYDALLERIRGRSLETFEDCFPWDDNDNDDDGGGGGGGGGVKLQTSSCLGGEEESGAVSKGGIYQTGWKRKAIAKGLKSLDISTPTQPTASSIARIKQHMVVQGQIYSPGTYVTPRFGSYNAPAMADTERDQNAAFSPELVAAFEDCMQQLQVEEDNILRQMDESSLVVDHEVSNPSKV